MKAVLPCFVSPDAAPNEPVVHAWIDHACDPFGRAGDIVRSMFSRARMDAVQRLHGLGSERLPGSVGTAKTIRFHPNAIERLALDGGA